MTTINPFPPVSFRDHLLVQLPVMRTRRMSIKDAKFIIGIEAFSTGYSGMHLDENSAWKNEHRMNDVELAYAVKVALQRGGWDWGMDQPYVLTVGAAAVIIDPQPSIH